MQCDFKAIVDKYNLQLGSSDSHISSVSRRGGSQNYLHLKTKDKSTEHQKMITKIMKVMKSLAMSASGGGKYNK